MRIKIQLIALLSNRKRTKPEKEKGVLVVEDQFVFQRLTSFEKGLSAWCSHRKGPKGWIHAGLRSGKC